MAAEIGNKYAIGNRGGRPATYKTPEELAPEIDAYFIYIQGEYDGERITAHPKTGTPMTVKNWIRYPEPATVTGLCLFLGFSSRSSLDDYEKRSDEFSCLIKHARTRVEYAYECRLHSDVPGTTAGAIFALGNMGWKNRQEVDHTTKGDKLEPAARTIIQWGDKKIPV